ncbi:heme-degrading domain-containing protein [Kozakia baliensis]|uniref:heme-degrading domain-containing protein n=1 Tax=Kozakia baliensis TaxID=153496 RepID=UPI000497821B|nr:heme-degrading domain-containing protein [Kozakia baliensis]
MDVTNDLSVIARQEKKLLFKRFDEDTAWTLGSLLRKWAVEKQWPIVIDIRTPARLLFFAALPGSAPDNADWARRKSNAVLRCHRSSYGLGLELRRKGGTMESRYGLPAADYAVHGGSFPLIVHGTGVIGSVTISGLPQRDDHDTVVRALCVSLGLEPDEYAFSDEDAG